MGMITKISLRNLIRQKRRNIFLGLGFALGMCLLVTTCSLTRGFTDTLLNKLMIYMTGHIRINMMEKDSKRINIIRDRDQMIRFAEENIEGIKDIWEDVGTEVPVRCLGNGKAGNIVLVGVWETDEEWDTVHILEGDLNDIFGSEIYNPIFLYDNIAEELNVSLYDIIRVKLTTIYGMVQTARFTVAAIGEAPNMFISTAAFIDIDLLKGLLGYKEWETGGLNIIMEDMDNPALVIEEANKLHEALMPGAAGIVADVFHNGNTLNSEVFAFNTDEESKQILLDNIKLAEGRMEDVFDNEDSAIVSEVIANNLQVTVGDTITIEYKKRFEEDFVREEAVVAGIYQGSEVLNQVFVNGDLFYKHYFSSLPVEEALFDRNSPLFPALVKQWTLLERSPDSDSSMQKYRELIRQKWKGAVLDVMTMYETASQVIQLEFVLNIVAFVAVFILFIVVLIGVVNTLRMSIRERTREIGTNRAIGMMKSDVRAIFVMEIFYLTVIACIVGLILAFLLMALLSAFPIYLKENPFSILLVNDRLYFLPTVEIITGNFIVIVLLATVIAFLTSRKASKMSIAGALRHYE
jgi:ABC-type lipoprotein release transport system permease subunit